MAKGQVGIPEPCCTASPCFLWGHSEEIIVKLPADGEGTRFDRRQGEREAFAALAGVG